MKRSDRGPVNPVAPDYSPLLRACMYLDEVLKRGVVIGIFEGSMEVSDEDIHKACTAVRAAIEATVTDMQRLARAITRAQEQPGSERLQ